MSDSFARLKSTAAAANAKQEATKFGVMLKGIGFDVMIKTTGAGVAQVDLSARGSKKKLPWRKLVATFERRGYVLADTKAVGASNGYWGSMEGKQEAFEMFVSFGWVTIGEELSVSARFTSTAK